jgi:hypothetical protein
MALDGQVSQRWSRPGMKLMYTFPSCLALYTWFWQYESFICYLLSFFTCSRWLGAFYFKLLGLENKYFMQ